MNELNVVRSRSKNINNPHLVVLIDGEPLELLIARIMQDVWYAGPVITLDDRLFRSRERQLVSDRILPAERAVAPILVCP